MLNMTKPAKWTYLLLTLLIVGLTTFTGRQLTMAQSSKLRPQQNSSTCTLIQGKGGKTQITAFGPGLDPTIESALTNNTNDPTQITVSLSCNSTNSIRGNIDTDNDNDANGLNNDNDRDNKVASTTTTSGNTDTDNDNDANGLNNDNDKDNGGSSDDD